MKYPKKALIINLVFCSCLVCFVGRSLGQNPSTEKGVFYGKVDHMPEFPGGEAELRNWIVDHVIYPEEAKKKNIEGKVYVSFVVDEEGKVGQVEIARGVHPLLDAEALRAIAGMPYWKAGSNDGEKVKVAYTLPIFFGLEEEKKRKLKNL